MGSILRWARRVVLVVSVVSILLAGFIAFTPPGWAGFQTGLFVLQVTDSSIKPQRWFTPDAELETVTYPISEGFAEADVYRITDDERRPAVVLFLGANAAGREDVDVRNLGFSLARAGYVVMIHWSETMAGQLNIDPYEMENLVWAFLFLRQQPYVDSSQVGLGGFCIGASFAVMAATDVRIREEVAFVNAFGPYYNARDLLLQVASRSRWISGDLEPWEPDRLTLLVLANEVIEGLDSTREKDILSRKFLAGEEVSEDELNELSESATAVRQLLEGVSPEEAERLVDSLPAEFGRQLEIISPSAYIHGLVAPVMILHDRDDDLIPAGESRRLAEAIRAEGGKAEHTELASFDHVRPGSAGGFWASIREGHKLYKHMYTLLRRAT